MDENPPTVTDAEGKNLPQSRTDMNGTHRPTDVTLEPGKEIALETRMHGASGSPFELWPVSDERAGRMQAWPLSVGTGKVGIQYKAVLGNSSSGKIKLDPILSNLATGKLELEVKEPERVPVEKQTYTAWGKEVGGVRAGLGFRPGAKRAYRTGETVALVLRVRNVGKEGVKFSHYHEEFREGPPTVTDDGGKHVPLEGGPFLIGEAKRIDVTLAPGETVDLGEMDLILRPASEKGNEKPVWTVFGAGKFQLQCDKAGGNIQEGNTGPDPILSKLATGKLELEVQPEPPSAPGKEAADNDQKPKPGAFAVRNATIEGVDEAAGVITVSFGRKDKPTRLMNVPLDKGVRVVASHALPGVAGLPHGLLTVDQGCRASNVAGATYPSDECRRTRL